MRTALFLRLTLAGSIVAGLFGLPAPAAAQRPGSPADQSEALVRQGNQLRSAGDDQNALPLFEKAMELNPNPRTMALLGLVEKALGRWSEADKHLTDALKAQQDPWIQKNVAILEKTLADTKRQVARIEITGEPVGADVLVNGRPVGKVPLPQPVRVNAGTVDIELRAPGYKSTLRTVAVVGLQYQPVVIRLEREGTAAPEPMGPVPMSAPPGADTGANPQPWRRWVIGGTLAGAAVGAAVGVFGVLRHEQKVADFNDKCGVTTDGTIVNKTTGLKDISCGKLSAAYKDAKTMAIVGFGAAAALGATALILHLTAPDGVGSEASARPPRLACAGGPGDLGLGCTLRF